MRRLIDIDVLFDYFGNDAIGETTRSNIEYFVSEKGTVEAIPKADYESRLKADIVTILEDLKKEMNSIKECEYQIYGKEHWGFVGKCQDIIQQKINTLRGKEDEKENS